MKWVTPVSQAVATSLTLLGLTLIALPAQESPAVVRLQQEVANLKFRLDYETGRLERTVQDLQRRVERAEMRPPAAGSLPPLPAPDPIATDGEILTHRLVVADAQGRARAALAYSDLFGPTLALMTPGGDVAAMLSAPAAGPRLELYDGSARVRVALELDSDGARLRFLDGDGAVVHELGRGDGR